MKRNSSYQRPAPRRKRTNALQRELNARRNPQPVRARPYSPPVRTRYEPIILDAPVPRIDFFDRPPAFDGLVFVVDLMSRDSGLRSVAEHLVVEHGPVLLPSVCASCGTNKAQGYKHFPSCRSHGPVLELSL